jgi:hypothetical protein
VTEPCCCVLGLPSSTQYYDVFWWLYNMVALYWLSLYLSHQGLWCCDCFLPGVVGEDGGRGEGGWEWSRIGVAWGDGIGVDVCGVKAWDEDCGVAVAASACSCGALIGFWQGIRIAFSEPFPASRSGATIFRVDSTDTPRL